MSFNSISNKSFRYRYNEEVQQKQKSPTEPQLKPVEQLARDAFRYELARIPLPVQAGREVSVLSTEGNLPQVKRSVLTEMLTPEVNLMAWSEQNKMQLEEHVKKENSDDLEHYRSNYNKAIPKMKEINNKLQVTRLCQLVIREREIKSEISELEEQITKVKNKIKDEERLITDLEKEIEFAKINILTLESDIKYIKQSATDDTKMVRELAEFDAKIKNESSKIKLLEEQRDKHKSAINNLSQTLGELIEEQTKSTLVPELMSIRNEVAQAIKIGPHIKELHFLLSEMDSLKQKILQNSTDSDRTQVDELFSSWENYNPDDLDRNVFEQVMERELQKYNNVKYGSDEHIKIAAFIEQLEETAKGPEKEPETEKARELVSLIQKEQENPNSNRAKRIEILWETDYQAFAQASKNVERDFIQYAVGEKPLPRQLIPEKTEYNHELTRLKTDLQRQFKLQPTSEETPKPLSDRTISISPAVKTEHVPKFAEADTKDVKYSAAHEITITPKSEQADQPRVVLSYSAKTKTWDFVDPETAKQVELENQEVAKKESNAKARLASKTTALKQLETQILGPNGVYTNFLENLCQVSHAHKNQWNRPDILTSQEPGMVKAREAWVKWQADARELEMEGKLCLEFLSQQALVEKADAAKELSDKHGEFLKDKASGLPETAIKHLKEQQAQLENDARTLAQYKQYSESLLSQVARLRCCQREVLGSQMLHMSALLETSNFKNHPSVVAIAYIKNPKIRPDLDDRVAEICKSSEAFYDEELTAMFRDALKQRIETRPKLSRDLLKKFHAGIERLTEQLQFFSLAKLYSEALGIGKLIWKNAQTGEYQTSFKTPGNQWQKVEFHEAAQILFSRRGMLKFLKTNNPEALALFNALPTESMNQPNNFKAHWQRMSNPNYEPQAGDKAILQEIRDFISHQLLKLEHDKMIGVNDPRVEVLLRHILGAMAIANQKVIKHSFQLEAGRMQLEQEHQALKVDPKKPQVKWTLGDLERMHHNEQLVSFVQQDRSEALRAYMFLRGQKLDFNPEATEILRDLENSLIATLPQNRKKAADKLTVPLIRQRTVDTTSLAKEVTRNLKVKVKNFTKEDEENFVKNLEEYKANFEVVRKLILDKWKIDSHDLFPWTGEEVVKVREFLKQALFYQALINKRMLAMTDQTLRDIDNQISFILQSLLLQGIDKQFNQPEKT